MPGGPTGQHVPLDQYKRNVQAILRHPLVSGQKPRLILITPPPFDEHQWGDGIRTAEHTRKYADTCRQAGEELGVVVLDLWSVFMVKAGWKPGSLWLGPSQPREMKSSENCCRMVGCSVFAMLCSASPTRLGLHFNPVGYKVLYDEIIRTIEREWPDQAVGSTGFVLPSWEAAAGETA